MVASAMGVLRQFRLVRQYVGACSHAMPAAEVTHERRTREAVALCGARLEPSWMPAPVTMSRRCQACMAKIGMGQIVSGKP